MAKMQMTRKNHSLQTLALIYNFYLGTVEESYLDLFTLIVVLLG